MPCLKAALRQKILMPQPHVSCLGISLACHDLRKTFCLTSVSTSLLLSHLGWYGRWISHIKPRFCLWVSLLIALISDFGYWVSHIKPNGWSSAKKNPITWAFAALPQSVLPRPCLALPRISAASAHLASLKVLTASALEKKCPDYHCVIVSVGLLVYIWFCCLRFSLFPSVTRKVIG